GARPPYTSPGGQQTNTGTPAGPDASGAAGSGASPTQGYSPWSSTTTGAAATGATAGPSAGPTAGGTSPSDAPGAGAGTYGAPAYGAPAYGAPPTGDPGAYAQYTQSAAAPSSTKTRQRSGRGPGWLALLVAMIVTAMIAVGSTLALGGGTQTAEPAATTTTQSTSQTVSPVQSSGDAPDWVAVAAAVSPATVTITVESQSSSDIGSGVIYDATGHIVTNYHVISAAVSSSSTTSNTSASTSGTITVTLSDGRVYEATVVGSDQTTDLAVIQLTNPPSDLTVATFGSSADLVVGQSVMAIGSPLGLSDTVTTGVVSALNRPVEVSTSETQETDPDDPFGQLPQQNQQQSSTDSVITNAIQVDASINPGNSGGPLFDATGAVVGINSSIASLSSSSDSSGSIGLGFAIPSDLVKSVADQLISTGTVDHAVLGVTIQSGTATVNGTTRIGAEVASVTSGGAAAEAGIKEGDVILSVDGNQVSSAKSLSGYVRRYKSGDSVTLEVARDGSVEKIQVTLGSKG
ncbi:MAG: trypsin-like peptidase domain-containing protein, partial [Pauljensenia sp.]